VSKAQREADLMAKNAQREADLMAKNTQKAVGNTWNSTKKAIWEAPGQAKRAFGRTVEGAGQWVKDRGKDLQSFLPQSPSITMA
jgi:mRNA-degrading endonuclease HigB of HigAB toxin-antitoxin module